MKKIALALALLGLLTSPALAANCSSYPYTLQNGQTADANQVMANFNNVLNCANNNLAHNGANNDITSITGLTTPLAQSQGGTGNTTGQPGGVAGGSLSGTYPNPSIGFYPNYHVQVFTSSGTLVLPANLTSGTLIRFTEVGGGGGGGGAKGTTFPNIGAGGGGGSGGAQVAIFSGFSPSTSVTVTIGNGGTAGSSSGGDGGTGGTTTIAYSAVTVATANGGRGGNGCTPGCTSVGTLGGAAGAFTTNIGASGLTLVSAYGAGAQPGGNAVNDGTANNCCEVPGNGGANLLGTGGLINYSSGTGTAGTLGAGGAGAVFSSTGAAGSAGGKGIVIAEYWL